MHIKILFFGILTEITGKNEIYLDNILDTKTLNAEVIKKYPQLKSHKFRMAVNQKLIDGEHLLENNDVVALMPPFAGG